MGGKRGVQKKRGAWVWACAAFCVCVTGCAGIMETMEIGGRALDGSLFAEKTRAKYLLFTAGSEDPALEARLVRRGAEEYVVITLRAFPCLRLYGTAPDPDGSFRFKRAHFLEGAAAGWNEFSVELAGTGVFLVEGGETGEAGNKGTLWCIPPIEIETLRLEEGRIRHKGSRLTGGEALGRLQNRQDRITALTDWMRGQADTPRFEKRKEFDDYWKPLVLPETVRPAKRPASFVRENAVWARGEDIRWNTGYTEALFPEELRTLRNSGALLRDWEEAGEWIYTRYQWEYIVTLLSERYALRKAK
ncbi:MAG: hypothetical protein LBD24_04575 [Spirochaetaceae bacterium]|nr:hypothetical protein [Spirochaetaceae bacterium]